MDKSFHYMIMVNQSLFQKKVLDALSKDNMLFVVDEGRPPRGGCG